MKELDSAGARDPRSAHKPEHFSARAIDWRTFAISGGFMLVFVIVALIDIDFLSAQVNSAFAFSARLFGAYWQLLVLLTFLIGLYVAVSDSGNVRLGNLDEPEIPTFQWFAIIMCTLLAGGGVFLPPPNQWRTSRRRRRCSTWRPRARPLFFQPWRKAICTGVSSPGPFSAA